MKKKHTLFMFLFVIIIASFVLYYIYKYVFNFTGKVNEGNYRINDLVIKNVADVQDSGIPENPADSDVKDLSGITLNISQNNNVLIQVAKTGDIDADSIYLDNISYTAPAKLGKAVIYQQDQEQKYDLSQSVSNIPLKIVTTSDGQYLINLNINNEGLLTNAKVPKDIKTLTYDGTIFNTFNIKYEDIKCQVKFDLNIKEKTGKVNKCTFEISAPNKDLIDKGISITREDIKSYNFVVQK